MNTKRLMLLFLCIGLFSCQEKKENFFLFTLQVEDPNLEQEYSINTSSFGTEAAYSFTLDENGSYATEVKIDEPKTISLSGNFYKSLYVTPGKSLTVKVKMDDKTPVFSYEGEGAVYPQIFDQLATLDQEFSDKYEELDHRQYSLDWDTFKQELDELTEKKRTIVETKTNNLSKDFEIVLEAHLFASKVNEMNLYGSYYNAYKKEEGEADFSVPGKADFYSQAFAFDAKALASAEFSNLISSYVTSKGIDQLGDLGDTPWYSIPNNWSKIYEFTKTNKNIPDAYKAYMLGSYVSSLTMALGIDGAWDIKEDFVKSYPNYNQVDQINTAYEKWEPLRKGNVAPDFEYESLNGEMVSLSSLKGSVVYVDVWATWCGPCISEFPSYKALKKRLEDAKDVKWLYVSVDEAKDKEKWVNFLAKNELDGIQLFGGNGWDTSITEKYQIRGIPRYLLIDKDGKIHSSNAPRPSSGDIIYDEIQKLRGVRLERATSLK